MNTFQSSTVELVEEDPMTEKENTLRIQAPPLPKAFIWRRWHSLTGLWLVGYLILHLFTNSQAALMVGEDAQGFIRAVNSIRELPFLPAIEIIFLAVPFLIHIYWGIIYLFNAKYNSYSSDGTKPSLPEYPRNHAYTWQRITSWILLVLITLHVIHMRFLEYPLSVHQDGKTFYLVRLNTDAGIQSVAKRFGVTLHNEERGFQEKHPEETWLESFKSLPLGENQTVAVTPDFGTAELLMVRNTFQSPVMLFLYTVLVLSACFHAFNGLWTACIAWGVTLSPKSQRMMYKVAILLMIVVTFLGLAAIWGTYWVNLKN